jgi:hypothetical protein
MINSLGPFSEGYGVLWYVQVLQNERFFVARLVKLNIVKNIMEE